MNWAISSVEGRGSARSLPQFQGPYQSRTHGQCDYYHINKSIRTLNFWNQKIDQFRPIEQFQQKNLPKSFMCSYLNCTVLRRSTRWPRSSRGSAAASFPTFPLTTWLWIDNILFIPLEPESVIFRALTHGMLYNYLVTNVFDSLFSAW